MQGKERRNYGPCQQLSKLATQTGQSGSWMVCRQFPQALYSLLLNKPHWLYVYLITENNGHSTYTHKWWIFVQASINKLLKGFSKVSDKSWRIVFGIRNRTLIGCISELGGSPLASSIAVIPSDQMSALR